MHASGFIHMRFFLERTEYLIGVTTNLQFASREVAQDIGPIVGKLGRRFRYRPELGKSLWPIWGVGSEAHRPNIASNRRSHDTTRRSDKVVCQLMPS